MDEKGLKEEEEGRLAWEREGREEGVELASAGQLRDGMEPALTALGLTRLGN